MISQCKPAHVLVLCLCTALLGARLANAADRPPELWVEVDTNRISFISAGTLSVKPCEGCAPLLLRVTGETTFRVDKKVVTVADWKQLSARGSGYGADVAYRTTDGTALLVTINSAAPLGEHH